MPEQAASLACVIPAEVDRFTNLRNAVHESLARLAGQQCDEAIAAALENVGHAFEDKRTLLRGRGFPCPGAPFRDVHGPGYIFGSGHSGCGSGDRFAALRVFFLREGVGLKRVAL